MIFMEENSLASPYLAAEQRAEAFKLPEQKKNKIKNTVGISVELSKL